MTTLLRPITYPCQPNAQTSINALMSAPSSPSNPPVVPKGPFRTWLTKLRQFNRPPDQPVPAGLGFFVVVLALTVIYLAFSTPKTAEAAARHSDAEGVVSATLAAVQGTIFTFDPRKRTFGYVLLTGVLTAIIVTALH